MFLPSVSNQYAQAVNRVMIVGLETRAWEPLKLDGVKPTTYENFQSVRHYVDASMNKHKAFFAQQLGRQSKGKGNSFHNFVRDIALTEGVDRHGLIYSNLFCFAWGRKKGSPTKSEEFFPVIKKLSGDILKAQIELLKPDYIVFTGFSGGVHRREFFGAEEANHRPGSKDIPERFLLEFTLQEKISCFRVDHPSSRYKNSEATENSRQGRLQVLRLLREGISGKSLMLAPG